MELGLLDSESFEDCALFGCGGVNGLSEQLHGTGFK